MDRRTDGQTDRRSDGQMVRRTGPNQYAPSTSSKFGHKNVKYDKTLDDLVFKGARVKV